VIKLRHERLQQEGQTATLLHVAKLLKDQPRGARQIFLIGTVPVCYDFWLKALGINKTAYANAKKLADNSSIIACSGREVSHKKASLERLKCVAFWRYFVQNYFQTPDECIYLWPSSQTFNLIYATHFKKYCEGQWMGVAIPSLSTLISARSEPEFNNVKRRAKHFHLKCDTCAILSEERLAGFASASEKQANVLAQQAHDEQVYLWHASETELTHTANHNPEELTLFKIDDTQALELPHCSNRPPKAMAGMYKTSVIPCFLENTSTGDSRYIYHLKGTFKKGGNRWCTIMYQAIMATKRSSGPASKARKLVIIADNYNENRNQLNLRFATELVMRGIYDTIVFLYGYLGHTHNGGDRAHNVHNNATGKWVSFTLADWIRSFPMAWVNEARRPTGVVMDSVYDWEARYRPYAIDVTGLHKRVEKDGGPFAASSFKVSRDSSGHVTVKYRQSCNLREPYLGQSMTPDSPGWIVLRSPPTAVPRPLPRLAMKHKTETLRDMNKNGFRKHMKPPGPDGEERRDRNIAWLQDAVTYGSIPVDEFHSEVLEPNRMGRLANIAPLGDQKVWVEFIEPVPAGTTQAQFWYTPTHSLRNQSREPVPTPEAPLVPPINYKRRKDQRDAEQNLLQPVNLASSLDGAQNTSEDSAASNHDERAPVARALAMRTKTKKKRKQARRGRIALQRNSRRSRASDSCSSAAESSLPPAGKTLLNTTVYIADPKAQKVYKGKVKGQAAGQRKGVPVQWMVQFKKARGDLWPYQYKELFSNRKDADKALKSSLERSHSDSASDGSFTCESD
jgi:hypothetical protein